MPKVPITGWIPDFSTYPLGPVPLRRPIPPGISIQALETIGGMQWSDLRRTPALRKDPIVKELGIPRDAFYYQLILDPPTGWEGLRLEIIGTKMEDSAPPDAFQWTDMFGQDQPVIIIAWRRRVVCTETPDMYLDVRWHPERGETNALVWPSHIPDKAEDRFKARARKLLQKVEARGRRPGPYGFKDAQEFEDLLVHLIQTADRKGQSVLQKRIALSLRPVLVERWGDTYSAASVDINEESTVRLIEKHISKPWGDLVRQARQSL
jgi:hypothetical protein